MRTPDHPSVRKPTPVEPKPDVATLDRATVSRPFADMLAEAEAVRDVVRLSTPAPGGAIGSPSWQDAWDGLRRGAGLVLGAEGRLPPVLRSRMRRIGR